MKYPYSITNTMLDYIGSIMEKIGQIRNYNNLNKMPVLRKNMRIHSIHSTLAIEANSLSLKEVKDVINDVLVVGPEQEIIEVKNAYKAYGLIGKINTCLILQIFLHESIKDSFRGKVHLGFLNNKQHCLNKANY